jgi:predicted GIY-YIG superfamily endonuclease
MNEYYIYKFIDEYNKIIYIGKTKNMNKRIYQHFGTNGHLPRCCYDKVDAIFYANLQTRVEMDIYESYLIDKYRPQYNSMSIYEEDDISSIALPELNWNKYLIKNDKSTVEIIELLPQEDARNLLYKLDMEINRVAHRIEWSLDGLTEIVDEKNMKYLNNIKKEIAYLINYRNNYFNIADKDWKWLKQVGRLLVLLTTIISDIM